MANLKVVPLSVPLVNDLVRYLSKQPWEEVNEFIQMMAQTQPVTMQTSEPKPLRAVPATPEGDKVS